MEGIHKCLSPSEASPCCWASFSTCAQARQDGLDAQGDGAHGHRSGRVTHGQKVQKDIRLPCPGRCPGDVVQHLLHQHLVIRRRDVGDLEKTPATTFLAPSVPALAPANSRNQTATRVGKQKDCQDAQQPDRTACCAWRGRRAAARIVQGWLRVTEREKQIGPWGAEKHRLAPPRTSISNFGSRSELPS